jgi:hypothetical protein
MNYSGGQACHPRIGKCVDTGGIVERAQFLGVNPDERKHLVRAVGDPGKPLEDFSASTVFLVISGRDLMKASQC